MNELALFAGAGGGILGGHLLGWRTVCAVEWEQYPASVLCARQNDGLLPPFPIWDDVQTFDGKPWRGVAQVISGGFPCQDISIAGKGDGLDGERSGMWRQMARIIREVGPEYVYVENSPMLLSRGLGAVLGDLSSMGFDAKWGIVGAKDVGANHQRDRIWIVAHSYSNGWTTRKKSRSLGTTVSEQQKGQINSLNTEGASGLSSTEGNVSNSMCNRLQRIGADGTTERQIGLRHRKGRYEEQNLFGANSTWWATEPDLGRVAHGVDARVDRLKAIGNGQVPLCAATAWRLLNDF
jgi:DNA (cytosine-5)-methyltransferase 1